MEIGIQYPQPSLSELFSRYLAGKLLVAFFFAVFPVFLPSIDVEDTEALAHENLELILDELPQRIWEQSFSQQTGFNFAINQYLAYDSGFNANQTLSIQRGGLKGRIAWAHESERLLATAQLKASEHYILGHYRPQWGEGLILPAKKGRSSHLAPGSPRHYQPLGFLADYEYKGWQFQSLASAQNRTVQLADGQISQLPQSRKDLFNSTRERIFASSMAYQFPAFRFGGIYYLQAYDLDFKDTEISSYLQSYGLHAIYQDKKQSMAAELALQKRLSAKLKWQIQSARWSQNWEYTFLNAYQKLAYTPHPGRLSRLPNQEEIKGKFSYQIVPGVKAEVSGSLNKQRSELAKSPWHSEHKLLLSYHDAANRLSISLSSLDKEILSAIDEAYLDSRPRHYRLVGSASNRLGNSYLHQAKFRHQYQDNVLDFSQNLWWNQTLYYQRTAMRLGFGYSFYSGGKYRILLPDDSAEGYQILSRSRLSLQGSVDYDFKKFGIRLRLQEELFKEPQLSASLQISYRV